MTAIELAEMLEQESSLSESEQEQAAAMLRKQDAAIKTLREALENARIEYDYHGNPLEDCDRMVLNALAATEGFQEC